MASHQVWHIEDKLYLVALTPAIKGFKQFIGIWLYTGPPAFLVDVGPSATSAALLEAIRVIGVQDLDYLLLTHIHIDHAGGIGAIAEAFPQAQIIGHGQGLPHLIQPERLWAGSVQSLGRTAKAYGARSGQWPRTGCWMHPFSMTRTSA